MIILTEPKYLLPVINSLGDFALLGKTKVFNLNANIDNSVEKLDLMPKMGMIDYTSPEFDSMYISTILNDEYYFMRFMYLMDFVKNNWIVFILIYNEDTIFNPIAEVLMKLIQQRYGYNYSVAESIEEVSSILLGEYDDGAMFTAPGILTFDADFNRYQNLLIKYYPQMFLNERIDDSGA